MRMIIVDRKKFLTMPEGTVYSHYMPQVSAGLMIKGEAWTNDWLYQDLLFEVCAGSSDEQYELLDSAEKHGTSFKLDLNCGSRDGNFKEDQLFMVYENSDTNALIETLKGCIKPKAIESSANTQAQAGGRKESGGSYE